jgi:hypothetical protein
MLNKDVFEHIKIVLWKCVHITFWLKSPHAFHFLICCQNQFALTSKQKLFLCILCYKIYFCDTVTENIYTFTCIVCVTVTVIFVISTCLYLFCLLLFFVIFKYKLFCHLLVHLHVYNINKKKSLFSLSGYILVHSPMGSG